MQKRIKLSFSALNIKRGILKISAPLKDGLSLNITITHIAINVNAMQ